MQSVMYLMLKHYLITYFKDHANSLTYSLKDVQFDMFLLLSSI